MTYLPSRKGRGGQCHWRDLQKSVKARIAKWRKKELRELWNRMTDLIIDP